MMKSLFKNALLALVFSLPFSATAEILEVYNWKANPGMSGKMYTIMAKAKTIQEALGIQVDVYNLQVGSDLTVDYVLRFDSMSDWGSKKDALSANEDWMALWAESASAGAGEVQSSLVGINLDSTKTAASFDKLWEVYNVFVYDAAPGEDVSLLSRFAEAQKIHEKLGARIDIYGEGSGGTGNFHYVMSFPNWTEMASFNDKLSESKAWAKFQSETKPGSAELVKSFSGSKAPI